VSRFRFIEAEKASYPIALLCRVLGVSRAGYYAWRRRGPSARATADGTLLGWIRQLHARHRGLYGAPRIRAELAKTGECVSRKRVARLMRQAQLRGRGRPPRRLRTTVADPAATPAPNRVARDFTPVAPDRLWVGDLTFIPTAEGWLFLAVLLDTFARRVVGWAMAEHMRAELALAALQMALAHRQPAAGQLVHHTDRGCQYTATLYQQALASAGITCSMSRAGNCYDNAVAESFFATLKAELVEGADWHTHAEARVAIFEYLEVFYNRQRSHSTLGYLSPAEYEAVQQQPLSA
jgi:transposase InsO family protein